MSTTDAPEGVSLGSRAELTVKLTSKELVSQMSSLTEADIVGLVGKTSEVSSKDVDLSMFIIFEFQGFDPYAIIRKLIVLQKYHKLSDDDLKQDIMYIVAANIYMGNLSGKTLSRRSQEGRDMVDELASKYQMKPGTTGTGLPSDVITFPRVAGTFPVLSCRMATKLPSKDMIGKPFHSEKVPSFMRMNAFASFCSKEMEMRTRLFLLKSVAAYSCDQSIVFEEGRLKKMKKTGKDLEVNPKLIAADQWAFIWNASESKVPELEMKQKVLTEFNVSGLYDVLKPIVENYDKIMEDDTPLPTKEEYESDLTSFSSL
jgi:hypothetical protein